jgi:hypothetical protein
METQGCVQEPPIPTVSPPAVFPPGSSDPSTAEAESSLPPVHSRLLCDESMLIGEMMKKR